MVAALAARFARQYGLGTAHAWRRAELHLKHAPCWQRALHKLLCVLTCGASRACLAAAGETPEEALERIVRAKVRRDVRQARAWDEELSELQGDAQEKRLIELARFEMLTPAEQRICECKLRASRRE